VKDNFQEKLEKSINLQGQIQLYMNLYLLNKHLKNLKNPFTKIKIAYNLWFKFNLDNLRGRGGLSNSQ